MKNVEVKATKTVVFNLQMTVKMALWLMGMMQNGMDESEEDKGFREELFTSLKESFDNVAKN